MRELSKNAIIIIGNGFDLAHGMPTSYNDFADCYLKEVIFKKLLDCINDKTFKEDDAFFKKDALNSIKCFSEKDKSIRDKILEKETSKEQKFHDHIKIFTCKLLDRYESKKNDDCDEAKKYLIAKKHTILEKLINNVFLTELYAEYDENANWFDIEQEYFNKLKKISESNAIEQLNTEFEEIKISLKEYLKAIEIEYNKDICYFFANNLIGRTNIYVINFNYTDTFSKLYKEELLYLLKNEIHNDKRTYVIEVNDIHGTLKEDIIFGYGDDTSKEYQYIKNEDNDEYLKNFKTFSYSMTNRYSDILDKIEYSENYEAFVIGHSLGRTDKTLLKEIFDDDKCLNIHLFKRSDLSDEGKKKEFNKLIMNISRIMSNERYVRKKIIPFSQIDSFPIGDNQQRRNTLERLMEIYGKEIRQILYPGSI